MALVGLVRVSTAKQETQRQHDALDPICERVFEEKVSGKLAVDHRPGLRAALNFMRTGDLLAVQEVDRLGRNLLEGLIVLNDLFEHGYAVKVLEGIAAGEHIERSFVLDMALALAEDRRRDISRKTKNGLEAARRRGRVGGRPRVIDDDKRAIILARSEKGESIRVIARVLGVSVAPSTACWPRRRQGRRREHHRRGRPCPLRCTWVTPPSRSTKSCSRRCSTTRWRAPTRGTSGRSKGEGSSSPTWSASNRGRIPDHSQRLLHSVVLLIAVIDDDVVGHERVRLEDPVPRAAGLHLQSVGTPRGRDPTGEDYEGHLRGAWDSLGPSDGQQGYPAGRQT